MLLVLATSMLFGATRAYAGFGLTAGIYLVWISVARIFGKPAAQLGGLSGLLVLVLSLYWAWHSYGTIEHLDRNLVWRVNSQLEAVSDWMKVYHQRHNAYPSDLSELKPTNRVTNQMMSRIGCRAFHAANTQ